MTPWTRRSFLAAAGCGLAACTSHRRRRRAQRRATGSTRESTPRSRSSTRTSPAPASSARRAAGHPGDPEHPQGRLLRLRRLRRGRAADRPGEGRLLLDERRRHRPDLRRRRVQPGAVLPDRRRRCRTSASPTAGSSASTRRWSCRQDGAAAGLDLDPDQPADHRGGLRPARPDRRREPRRREVQPHHPLSRGQRGGLAGRPARARARSRVVPIAPARASAGSSDIGMYSARRQSAARSS